MKLSDKLNNLECYPFHMPGHKRNPKFGITGSEIDITEIDGFDNLHDADGVLLDVETRLSKIYKSEKSFMLINGSTVGILSAIFAVCNEGDLIIVARNCHKSVYNACMLRHLRLVYIEPEFDYVNGYYTRLLQSTVDNAVSEYPQAKCVIITSPTYEGNISNIKTDIPLIIDAAHGAHLGMGSFPAYPKADIVVSSLHKTLPALTQTAVSNVYNEEYINRVKLYLDIFETSSPSYVLMDSVSKCCDFAENGRASFEEYTKMLWDFRDIDLYNLRLKYSDDFSKLVISTANTDLTGTNLAEILRRDYNIEVEMASKSYVVLMTSVGDTQEGFERLKNALLHIDSALLSKSEELFKKPPIPTGESVINIDDKSSALDLRAAIGKVSNEFVYAYPPDIPIFVPGETVKRDTVNYLNSIQRAGVNVVSDSGLLPNKLLTKSDI
ncbi:MAG: aminotransferase class I/II-fold pyridoxal phosphate-dependent enzyme [Eubacterium sp.]